MHLILFPTVLTYYLPTSSEIIMTSGPQYTHIYMTPLILYQALIDCILYANFYVVVNKNIY